MSIELQERPDIEPTSGDPVISRTKRSRPLFDPPIVRRAVTDSVVKLNPRTMMKNPVMFVVWVGSVLTSIIFVKDVATHVGGWDTAIVGQIAMWLWFTVLFANFAEAIAEGRGKAQADELRKTRTTTKAKRLSLNGKIDEVPAPSLRKGDIVRRSG